MLADVSRQTKYFIVSVPCYLLDSRQVVLILVRFLSCSLVHAACLPGRQLVILRQLLLSHALLVLFGALFALLPCLLNLNLILTLPFLSLLLLKLTLLQLLLLPFLAFSSHLCLFLLLLRLFLLFSLLALTYHLFLLLSGGFLSGLATLPLLFLFFLPLSLLLFSLGGDSFLGLRPFYILLTVTGLSSFTSLDLGLERHTLLVSLFASPQKLCLFLSFLVLLVSHSVLRCLTTAAATATDLRFVLTGLSRLACLDLGLEGHTLLVGLFSSPQKICLFLSLLVLLVSHSILRCLTTTATDLRFVLTSLGRLACLNFGLHR